MKTWKFRRRDVPVLLGLIALLISFWLALTQTTGVRSFLERVEHIVYDFRLTTALSFEQKKQPSIVIVDIDEKSLAKEGRWPWSRKKVGQLVKKLFEQQVALVGFDILFSEPERNVVNDLTEALPAEALPAFLLDALKPLAQYFDVDERFGALLSDKEVVLGFLLHNDNNESGHPVGELPFSPVARPVMGEGVIPELIAYTGNSPKIQKTGTSAGFLTNFRDKEGVVRRSPLVLRYKDIIYPALSLEMARHYLLIDKVTLKTAQEGDRWVLEGVQLGPSLIETDAIGQVLVPFWGGPKTFTTVSATDVLADHVKQGLLGNNIVLIGTSALGLGDLLATPVSPVFPGVEVHASILAGILEHAFHTEPSWGKGATWFLMILVGLVLVVCLPRLGPLMMIVVGTVVYGLLVALNFWFWIYLRLALELSVPLISAFFIVSGNLAYGFFVENRRRGELKSIFGQYVPAEHIEEMANEDNPQFGFEGEAREMSVLFTDIRNFTTLAEPLEATELKTLLNEFLTPMTSAIFKHDGTIDKYVGDMIMAFWGAPLRDKNHAQHAIAAGLEMLEVAKTVSASFQTKGLPAIQIGVGVNTGMMNVGDMGSVFRRSYTVLGDAVNLASRLEGLTKHYGVPILVSEETARAQPSFLFMKIDKVRVRGKRQTILIYQPLGDLNTIGADKKTEVTLFEAALENYFAGRWSEAKTGFEALQKQFGPQKLFSVYPERIAQLAQEETTHWDGVYTMLEK